MASTENAGAPSELDLARLLRAIRTTGADLERNFLEVEPTHRFPDIEKLYDELYIELDGDANDKRGNVIPFARPRAN